MGPGHPQAVPGRGHDEELADPRGPGAGAGGAGAAREQVPELLDQTGADAQGLHLPSTQPFRGCQGQEVAEEGEIKEKYKVKSTKLTNFNSSIPV